MRSGGAPASAGLSQPEEEMTSTMACSRREALPTTARMSAAMSGFMPEREKCDCGGAGRGGARSSSSSRH